MAKTAFPLRGLIELRLLSDHELVNVFRIETSNRAKASQVIYERMMKAGITDFYLWVRGESAPAQPNDDSLERVIASCREVYLGELSERSRPNRIVSEGALIYLLLTKTGHKSEQYQISSELALRVKNDYPHATVVLCDHKGRIEHFGPFNNMLINRPDLFTSTVRGLDGKSRLNFVEPDDVYGPLGRRVG